METTIMPQLVSEKTSKAGKQYWQIKDEQGNVYSCFEKDIADQIKAGNPVSVDVFNSKDGNFKNIRGIGESQSGQASEPVNTPVVNPSLNQPEKKEEPFADSVKARTARELLGLSLEHGAEDIVARYKKILAEL